ncbi:hypothetical protein D9Q98_007909 [Chlorella vulgaris]|uniref:Uncharacterized protein n=1 Tax=Chlorella vulgaris TaxID=3077 RepID=A0A9D4THU7_CHLVU|nr:hypothetical protein D9Q98_007909 [Chlorella vulgaris]
MATRVELAELAHRADWVLAKGLALLRHAGTTDPLTPRSCLSGVLADKRPIYNSQPNTPFPSPLATSDRPVAHLPRSALTEALRRAGLAGVSHQ